MGFLDFFYLYQNVYSKQHINTIDVFSELERMSEDSELQKLAEQDLEKLDLTLSDLISDASRLLLPGRDFDSNNSVLEVNAGLGILFSHGIVK